MMSWLTTLLVTWVASVVTSARIPPISSDIQDLDSIILAIDFYNQEQNETSIFKLLDVDNNRRLDDSANNQELNFRIKQTVCQKTETQNTEECEFKEDGLVKDCSAYVLYEKEFKQETGATIITCEPVDQQKTVKSRKKRFSRRRGRKRLRFGMYTLIGHVDKKKNNYGLIWAK
ncbi:cathelicidin antimicrobial peptide [Microcaecilia unicolor]|uniref:Cathelicidin-6-like n=1 Tax=Microcaecilia unicolor TaxID=1415580 RepID=A0A6P7WZS9_9AMPH|nr:cathelicidin-6-like [Microcaecilia unicolor]